MQYNTQNIFNKIIHKTIPAEVVLEDEHCVAFKDINPQAAVHVVIIPKLECVDFEDFIDKTGGKIDYFFKFILKVARKLELTDYRIITNKGKEVGQIVFHFHAHLLSGGLSEKGLF